MAIDGVAPGMNNSVPPERPPVEERPIKPDKSVEAGNLKGANLQFDESVPMQELQSAGMAKPTLRSPASEPSMKSYQNAANAFERVALQLDAEQQAGTLAGLARALSAGSDDGKGGVLIGQDGQMKQGVLAHEVHMKNTTPGQARDMARQLQNLEQELATLESAKPEAFEQTKAAISKFQQTLSNGQLDAGKAAKLLSDIQQSMKDETFTFDQSKKARMTRLMEQLAPSPLPDVEVTNLKSTDTGLSARLDNNGSFDADFKNGKMTMNLDGQEIKYQFESKDTITATVNGKPMEIDLHETKAMADFFQLMALFHEMGVTMRRAHREGRNASQEMVVEKIKMQADEQRKAAAQQFTAGMISASTKVASGLIQMRGAVKAMKAPQGTGDAVSMRYRGISSLFEGFGEAGASVARYQAGLTEAGITGIRAEEEQARFAKQTEQDQMEVAKDITTKARETYAQVWNSFLQAQTRISGNI